MAAAAQPDFQRQLQQHAQAAGFDLAGMTSIPLREAEGNIPPDYFEDWIAADHAGEMEYLKRRDAESRLLRSSLETAFPWAKSLVVCAANYNADKPRSIDPAPEDTGWIARYAWSGKRVVAGDGAGEIVPSDYHNVLLGRLRTLEASLPAWLGPIQMRSYVDTGPIVERAYAHAAGIGWTGKNTCILNQQLGSWLFLGVIVTSFAMLPEQRPAELPPDRCGTCRRCIEACPTDALIAPYEMDASRCIAYLTIEKRGPIAEHFLPQMGRQIFGCDICQDVCPWNRRAPVTADPELTPREQLVNPTLAELAGMDAQAFNRTFKGSPVQRTKLAGMRRNIAIAMGNSKLPVYLPQLTEWCSVDEDGLQAAAKWARATITESEGG